ncbi:MAG: ABC transporter substrate-binding protein [Acidobacteriota bacterium]
MSDSPVRLRGITWNHTRGFLPMVAAAQRFQELNGVRIAWEIRPLQDFADASVPHLAQQYDLLVIDHPSVPDAAEAQALLPLDQFIAAPFMQDQAQHSVGPSYLSYLHDGHLWALPIDAAAPVSGWRPDLLPQPPSTWDEVLELARAGRVALPAIPIDSLMHFFMLCVALGEEPFQHAGIAIGEYTGREALSQLRSLLALCDPACLTRNPIATWEALASDERLAYCPFAYGYSNYARDGYAPHRLSFGALPSLRETLPLRSVLGGAGLAISAHTQHRETCATYAEFVASPRCQSRLYFDSGGQPGHRAAWLDDEVNRRSHDFFRNTLATLDAAWLRPRFAGYPAFQDRAGALVHEHLLGHADDRETLRSLNHLLLQTPITTGKSEHATA